jgi:hypothetical protein
MPRVHVKLTPLGYGDIGDREQRREAADRVIDQHHRTGIDLR